MSEAIPKAKPLQHRSARRALGGALDGLVRAVRADLGLANGLASRAALLWREDGLAPMLFEANLLRVGADEALSASSEQGRWILPAFMAGLREVRPHAGVVPDDLRRLAERFATLEPRAASLAEFQEWLWADGAEGFDVKLEPSFVEMLDARGHTSDSLRSGLAAVRAEALFSVDGVAVAVVDLDVAALRPEMQISLDAYAGAVMARELEVSGTTLRALGAACDDPSGWAVAEVAALLELPAVRAAVPPQRLAGRLGALVANRCDTRMLALIGMLSRADDPYVRAVLAALEAQSVGRDIARTAMLEDPTTRAALVDALSRLPSAIAGEIVAGLLERAAETDLAVATLADFWREMGAVKFGDLTTRITSGAGTSRAGAALSNVAIRAGAGSRDIVQIADRVPESVALAFLLGVPTTMLSAATEVLDRVIISAADREAVVRLVAHAPSAARATATIARLRRDRGVAWPISIIVDLLRTAIAHGAASAVVEITRDRRVLDAVRLASLDALDHDRELQLAAARWTPAMLLESMVVRHATAAVRARWRDR